MLLLTSHRETLKNLKLNITIEVNTGYAYFIVPHQKEK